MLGENAATGLQLVNEKEGMNLSAVKKTAGNKN